MAGRVRISDLDFVFISYNEPNKEKNWADHLAVHINSKEYREFIDNEAYD